MRGGKFLRSLMVLGLSLFAVGILKAGVEGDPAHETPSSARIVPFRLGSIDAVTGDLLMKFPVGPRLPGRIPLGFTYYFDSQNTTQSQIGGYLKPVVWPGVTASPMQVTVLVDGQEWAFYRNLSNTATPAPTVAQLHQRMATFSPSLPIDDGSSQVDNANALSAPTFTGQVYASMDGTRFLLMSDWEYQITMVNQQGQDYVGTTHVGQRAVIFNGANAIWTDYSAEYQNRTQSVTHFVNTWGDHVTVTESGGSSGAPTSIVIQNANYSNHSILWTLASNTITVTNTLGLPKVVLTGSFQQLMRQPNPLFSDSWITLKPNVQLYDGGFLPTQIQETATDGGTRTTTLTWDNIPAHTLTQAWMTGSYTVPIAYRVRSIAYPSGLTESMGYNATGNLSTDAFGQSNGVFYGYSPYGQGGTDVAHPEFFFMQQNPYSFDPPNPVGGAWGVVSLQASWTPASGQTSNGYSIIIGRQWPTLQWAGQPTAANVYYGWTWSAHDHITTILRFDGGNADVSTAPFRGVRLTHPSATDFPANYPSQLAPDPNDYLFVTSAVLQEEKIHGANLGISWQTVNWGKWTIPSCTQDQVTTYQNWTLQSWINALGNLTSTAPVNPVASKVQTSSFANGMTSPNLPTSTALVGNWDSFGPTRKDALMDPPQSFAPVTGTTPELWASQNLSLPAVSGSGSSSAIQRTSQVTRHWDPSLYRLVTDSEETSLSGNSLSTLRQGVSGGTVDFGTTAYSYDSLGRVSSVTGTRTGTQDTFVATESRTYQAGQPLVTETTKTLTKNGTALPLSGQVGKKYIYDTTPFHWLASETDKLDGRATTYTYDTNNLGRVTQIVDPDGVTTNITYDAWGHVASRTRQSIGGIDPVSTTYYYEPDGTYMTETVQSGSGPALTTRTDYDAAGRAIKVTDPDNSYQVTTYDGFGEKTSQSPLMQASEQVYGNTTFTYDGKGRLTTTVDPLGRTVFSQPNDPAWDSTQNGVSVTTFSAPVNAGGAMPSRTEVTDLLGQKLSVTDQLNQKVTYAYDKDGHLSSTSQGQQTRSYAYNDMGWLMSRTEPEEGTTAYTGYTLLGTPLTTTVTGTNSQSTMTQVTLGSWGLPSEIQTYAGSTLSTDRTLNYDSAHHWVTDVWETQPNGTLAEHYIPDALGRMLSKTLADEGGQSFTVSRTLDGLGNTLSLSYPAGGGQPSQTEIIQYDSYLRPSIVSFAGTQRETMAYNQVNGTQVVSTLTYGATGSTLRTVTTADKGQLTNVTHYAAGLTGGQESNSMTWSAGGLLWTRNRDSFTYDNLQRLSAATVYGNDPAQPNEVMQQSFTYDLYGNRSGVTSSYTGLNPPSEALSWTVDTTGLGSYAANNQLPAYVVSSTSGSTLYTGRQYDDLGRITQVFAIPGQTASQTSWTYDAANRVVSEATGTTSPLVNTYLLDSSGLRFRRKASDESVQYTVYGFSGEPLAVFNQAAPASSSTTTSTSTRTAKTMAAPIGGGGGGGGGNPPSATALITKPSGPLTVTVGTAVAFQGQSTYGTSFAWTFGDSGTATGLNASHTYTQAGTYTVSFSASDPNYTTATANVTVKVVGPPTISSFTGPTTSIAQGSSAQLTWTTTGAVSATIQGSQDATATPVAVNGTDVVAPSASTTYTLTATNAGGTSVTSTFTLQVQPTQAPVINSFSGSPTAVPSGQAATLQWNVTGASSLSISGVGTVTGTSVVVHPTATTTYMLSATNGSGTVTATTTVTIITVPVINRFSAEAMGIVTGQSDLLSWDVTGATALSISSVGSVDPSTNSVIVSPTATTTYILTATNAAGGSTATVTVSVAAPQALAWSESLVYGLGTLICEDQAANGTVYMMGDQVGSPNYLVNAAGGVVGRSKNLPFGERFGQSGVKSYRRYTNHEDDPNTSAIYMQAREYLPAYGKFAEIDPAYDQAKLDPESWNLYNYVTNNPVTHTDPDGRMERTDPDRMGPFAPMATYFDTDPVAEADASFAYSSQQDGSPENITVYASPDQSHESSNDIFFSADIAFALGPSPFGPGTGMGLGLLGLDKADLGFDLNPGLHADGGAQTKMRDWDPLFDGFCGASPHPDTPDLEPIADTAKYKIQSKSSEDAPTHALFSPEVALRLSWAILDLNKLGIVPQINSGFRTREEQLAEISGGSGSNPAAKTSWHESGDAVDINGTKLPQFKTIISVMEKYGFKWGGTFINKKDPPHFDGRLFVGRDQKERIDRAASYWNFIHEGNND